MSEPREYDLDEMPLDDEQDPRAGAGDVNEQLQAEIENLRAEKQALFEKLARAQADYQNSQRRLEKELDQRLKLAAGQLVKAFLPVLDNIERAIEVDESADTASVIEGVRGTYRQWLDVLSKNGVVRIAPEAGTPFDPTHMEALMQEFADYPVPSVTRLLQPGYEFEGRVLRPAQVAVSRS